MNKHVFHLVLGACLAVPAASIAQNTYPWPASGKVGIGTSAPDSELTINGSVYSGTESNFVGAHIKNVADGGDSSLWLQNSSKTAYIRLKNNYSPEWLKIDDGVNTKLAIDANGNVGIGTSAPFFGNKLEAYDPVHATIASRGPEAGFSILDPSGVNAWSWQMRSDVGGTNNDLKLMRFNANGYQGIALQIQSATGNVGLGTSTPQAKFHVAGTALFDFSGTGGGQLAMGNNPNDNRVYIQAANSTGTDPAAEMVLAGYATRSLPKFSVVANVSAFSGKITTTTLELTSDRNQKQDFQPVTVAEVLDKVAKLPVSTWAYTNSPVVRHLGPMAQDFKAAFSLGGDDKHIGAGDGIGVALAAIQGLHQIVQEKDSEIAALKRDLAGMKQELASVMDSVQDRLAALEKVVSKRNFQQTGICTETIGLGNTIYE